MSGQLFILLMMNMMMMMLMLVVVVVKKIADNDEKPLLVLVHICNCSHKLTQSIYRRSYSYPVNCSY